MISWVRSFTHFIISKLLDLELWLIETERSDLFFSFISGRLQKYPFWCRGHLRIGVEALKIKKLDLAYASSQASIILGKNSFELNIMSQHLLARCYMAAGQIKEALVILTKITTSSKSCSLKTFESIKEDLAAAHMGLGEDSQALSILNSIAYGKLSPEGRATRKYLVQKEKSETASS
ncbi:MAG: hypothetical protein SGJ02_01670 [bacterium]|nr:hypothetical protein [bacterium]